VSQHDDHNLAETGQEEGDAPSSSLDASGHNAFIQRWLWLGLLEEVTTIKINPKMSNPTRTHWIQPAYKFR
jgi:hypothetical protein